MEELSEYIKQKEQWLSSVLDRLGWTTEGLQKGNKLMRCPINEHHYVLDNKLEEHRRKCGQQDDPGITGATVHITPSLQAAVLAHVKTEQENLCLQQQQAMVLPMSLVDDLSPDNDVFAHGPLHIISYMKSWKLVPKMFAVVNPAFLKMSDVKAWLFRNLPRGHSHSTVIGGEVFVVESIIKCLMQPGESGTVDPDYMVRGTQYLLGASTTPFILELWRYLSISSLQEQHSIPNSVVNDLAPLPVHTTQPTSQRFPSHLIQTARQGVLEEEMQNHGMGLTNAVLSVDDRSALYDFVIEAAGGKNIDKITGDLYRDDFNPKLQKGLQQSKTDAEVESIEELARQRDYKRRRQTYRAKNVHITKRSTVEVMRDVINARMAELIAQAEEDQGTPLQSRVDSNDPYTESSRHFIHHQVDETHHRHRNRSRSPVHDEAPPDKHRGSVSSSHDLDSLARSSHDTKHPSSRHEAHKSRSHKRHRSRSRSRDKKHRHKHKHKHDKDRDKD